MSSRSTRGLRCWNTDASTTWSGGARSNWRVRTARCGPIVSTSSGVASARSMCSHRTRRRCNSAPRRICAGATGSAAGADGAGGSTARLARAARNAGRTARNAGARPPRCKRHPFIGQHDGFSRRCHYRPPPHVATVGRRIRRRRVGTNDVMDV
ncbi:hypothetical protein NP493_204g07039 [Ridgeia piscesae]|uniref:Uncharacterized protein n=1 Tax=Ridgeia piscesae TaxID=27915 RepID=A0AAD9P0W2_RIDPI|nr:hypothetical protein NP493_204g07039 [Ridgeia piscesae]